MELFVDCERDFLAIRRNGWVENLHSGVGKLQSFGAVRTTAPQGEVWIRQISDPLAVERETGTYRRNACKERCELLGILVIAHEFSTPLHADGKDALSVATRAWPEVG